MSRRSLPSIPPGDLRPEVDAAMVDRIWERLDRDLDHALPSRPAARAGSFGRLAWAAAAAATFGVGLGTGRLIWGAGPEAPHSAQAAAEGRAAADLLAAGRGARTFELPGGGRVDLEPGSMVELRGEGAGTLRLELLQGAAIFVTPEAARALAIAVGDATVSAPAGGTLRVGRDGETMEVAVEQGTAELAGPGGRRSLGQGERAARVPLRDLRVSRAIPTTTTPPHERAAPSEPRRAEKVPAEEPAPIAAVPAPVQAPPSWADHAKENYAEALRVLREQPGGIDGAVRGASSARELLELATVLHGKEPAARARALERILNEFPDDSRRAALAARDLWKIYEKSNPELAQKYQTRAKELDDAGPVKDAILCGAMRKAYQDGNKEEASRLAKEYVDKHPDGGCKDEAKRLAEGESEGEEAEADEGSAEPAPAEPAPEP